MRRRETVKLGRSRALDRSTTNDEQAQVRHKKQHAMQIDDGLYRRFDVRNTAFRALSRDLGRDWRDEWHRSIVSLVAQGKTAPKLAFEDPADALFHYGFQAGFGIVEDLAASWGLGQSSGKALCGVDFPTELADSRCTDKARLTREARRVARHCGAVLTGVAELDMRWMYAHVQRRDDGPGDTVGASGGKGAPSSDEAFALPAGMKYVILVAVPMNRGMVSTAPSLLAGAATDLGYSQAAFCVLSVAAYVRGIGYQAIPSLNDTGLTIPMAVEAGLGELGRNGLLITREYGPCVRLAKVITDMPLLVDHPVDFGIQAYCDSCRECARRCAAGAISDGEPSHTGHNPCNNDGVLKWYVDAPKCLRYWMASGTSCGACIASCPFTWGRGWWLGLPQWLISHTRLLDGLISWLDRRFASRKQVEPAAFLAMDGR